MHHLFLLLSEGVSIDCGCQVQQRDSVTYSLDQDQDSALHRELLPRTCPPNPQPRTRRLTQPFAYGSRSSTAGLRESGPSGYGIQRVYRAATPLVSLAPTRATRLCGEPVLRATAANPAPFRLRPVDWEAYEQRSPSPELEPAYEPQSLSHAPTTPDISNGEQFAGFYDLDGEASAATLSSPKEVHVCSRCGSTFTRRSSLKLHARTHTGARRACTLELSGLVTECRLCSVLVPSAELPEHLRVPKPRMAPLSRCTRYQGP